MGDRAVVSGAELFACQSELKVLDAYSRISIWTTLVDARAVPERRDMNSQDVAGRVVHYTCEQDANLVHDRPVQ